MTVSDVVRDATGSNNIGSSRSPRSKLRYTFLRPALDACVAFAMFVLVSLAFSSGPSSASPHRLLSPGTASALLTSPTVATPNDHQIFHVAARPAATAQDPVRRQTDTAAAWLLLSFAFSALAALNMALVRHLRQAYADPRKRPQS